MAEPAPDGTPILLRQRPIPDQCNYLAEKLAAHLEPGTMPHEAYIAVGATIVNLGAIGTEVRALQAAFDAATARAEHAEAKAERLHAHLTAVEADRESIKALRHELESLQDKQLAAVTAEALEQRTRAEQAEARLAEIGKTSVEWGVRGGGGTFRVDGEAEARWHTQDPVMPMTVVHRLAGEWREVTGGGES